MVFGRQLAAASGQGAAELGDLPEWDLADLYSGMDAPELKRDIAKALADAISFESHWKGTLAAEAERADSGGLGEALAAYEALEELIGRIVS
ncbi:MAG: oligoendopeptidase F, partial [Mesorhizobium sp.]